jgi:hypothetical protein
MLDEPASVGDNAAALAAATSLVQSARTTSVVAASSELLDLVLAPQPPRS